MPRSAGQLAATILILRNSWIGLSRCGARDLARAGGPSSSVVASCWACFRQPMLRRHHPISIHHQVCMRMAVCTHEADWCHDWICACAAVPRTRVCADSSSQSSSICQLTATKIAMQRTCSHLHGRHQRKGPHRRRQRRLHRSHRRSAMPHLHSRQSLRRLRPWTVRRPCLYIRSNVKRRHCAVMQQMAHVVLTMMRAHVQCCPARMCCASCKRKRIPQCCQLNLRAHGTPCSLAPTQQPAQLAASGS